MTLRTRLRCWTCLGGALALALVGLVLVVTRLMAQGALPAESGVMFNWFSFAGVAALCGVAVQWGATRERMKDITSLKDELEAFKHEVTERLNRFERKIDHLYEVLHAERRSRNRNDYGARMDPEADGQ